MLFASAFSTMEGGVAGTTGPARRSRASKAGYTALRAGFTQPRAARAGEQHEWLVAVSGVGAPLSIETFSGVPLYLTCSHCGLSMFRAPAAALAGPCPRCAAPAYVLRRRSLRSIDRTPISSRRPCAGPVDGRPPIAPRRRLEPFRIEVQPERKRVHVRLFGELDVSTAGRVERQLVDLRDAGWSRLVLDLSGLSFLCSTGVHLVLRWTEAARADGFELTLVPGRPEVQRVFDTVGITDQLPFAPEEAADAQEVATGR
jgi:anti-sigma B factor antagonist